MAVDMGGTGLRAKLKVMSFEKFHALGWPEVIPLLPPRAPLEPWLAAKIEESGKDMRGKAPGMRKETGWGVFQWKMSTFSLAQARAWAAMYEKDREVFGPQVGHRTGNLVALDCDFPDVDLARAAHGAVKKYLIEECGIDPASLLTRQGNKPKWLIPLRMPPKQVTRGGNASYEHPRCKAPLGFQILGEGQQVVLWGEHPATRLPYSWRPHDPRSYLDLPLITHEQLEGVMGAVRAAVEAAGGRLVKCSHGRQADPDAKPVDQASLKGPQEYVTDAVRHIPNNAAVDYATWMDICFAIRAASVDWEGAGRELWLEFCERWRGEHGEANPPEFALAKWDSCKPPFRRGAQYLYDRAAEFGGWNKARADVLLDMVKEQTTATREEVASDALPWQTYRDTQVTLPRIVVARGMAESEGAPMSEKAVAHRFFEAYANRLVFAGETQRWYGWNGRVWQHDTTDKRVHAHLHQFISAECDRFKASTAAQEMSQKELASTLHRLRGRKYQEYIARFLPELFNVSVENFDVFPHLLNTPSGCIDLRTGEAVKLHSGMIVTRMTRTPLAPAGAPAPQFARFLEQVTQGDRDLQAYLQRAIGYTLYGELPEHVLFYLYGPGGNGKSVFLDVLSHLLGNYSTVADRRVFLQQRFQDHSTTRASLAGFRFITVPEVNEDSTWNDALVKEWSAGNWVKARFMRQDEFQFKPEGTLWFSGNSKPRLHKVDPAIERRMRMIEFRFRPDTPDLGLKDRLIEQEGPAILRWAVEGCLQWRSQGLGSCRHVESATRDYLSEFDPVRSWVNARCLLEADTDHPLVRDALAAGRHFVASTSDLYEDYARWCKQEMRDSLSQRVFVQQLKDLPRVKSARAKDERRLRGIILRVSDFAAGVELTEVLD